MSVIKTLEQFIKEHGAINKKSNHLLFYRGHGEQITDILPVLFRKNGRKNEEHLFFKKSIGEHPVLFNDDKTTLDKLVRMQHYGIPTRLLDITQNPLVALYFACCDYDKKKDGEVIVFTKRSQDIKYYDSDAVSIVSNLCKLSPGKKKFNTKLKQDKFNEEKNIAYLLHAIKEEKPYFTDGIINPKDLETCFFVYAKKNNERIKAQNGLFIIYGIDSKIQKEICQRLVIDKDSKKNILKQLENINITNQTLFPELESTAKFLKKRYGGAI